MVQIPGPDGRVLVGTLYRPPGTGPYPLIVLSHGSPPTAAERPGMDRYRILTPIDALLARGFVVLVPMRRGFGATGGTFVEGYGTCANPDYRRAGMEASRDILAAMQYGQNLSFVKPDRVLLAGQSLGGYASIAAASQRPKGLVGVVNFAGGNGGLPQTSPGEPCRPERLEQVFATWGASTTVPVLWHYSENDQFFGPKNVRRWYDGFIRAGGKGTLVMQPPYGADGHGVFPSPGGVRVWTPAFDRFTAELRL